MSLYSTTPRIRNRVNRKHLGILGLRMVFFCALVTKETSKETYKNRNSLAWLKNTGSYFAESYCISMSLYVLVPKNRQANWENSGPGSYLYGSAIII